MAVTHSTSVRNGIVDFVVDKLDVGSGTASGRLTFLTAADADICALTLANPAFGSASSGSASLLSVPITSSAAASSVTVAKAQGRDRDANMIFACAVGTSGSDINLSGVALGSGDTITINSLTYSHA